MATNFLQIPSELNIIEEKPKEATVQEELDFFKELLSERQPDCKRIQAPKKPQRRKKTLLYTYRYFCVCPRYNPNYLCKHSGNVIIDRDVLTKQEHFCYLSTPKEQFPPPHKRPYFYQKRITLPGCTARIEKLAMPGLKRVRDNIRDFKGLLSKRHVEALQSYLLAKPDVQYFNIKTALSYMEEEKRLRRVAQRNETRRCRKIKHCIMRKQRRQIRKIIQVIFEEMRDFLLNDQFLVDERSTLCTVVLEQIRQFTDKEFYTTSNLREYQQILANNMTVWINKFISNLNIHVTPPQRTMERPDPSCFLPVSDYMSCTESDEEAPSESAIDYDGAPPEEEGDDYYQGTVATDPRTNDTNQ